MSVYRKYEVSFFTATILNWQKLLKPNKYKEIILESLRFLVDKERVTIYGFVIMDNHLHTLWKITYPYKTAAVQRDFLKFTAQAIKFDLLEHHPQVLEYFKVDAKDRQFQFWERNPLSVDIWTEAVLHQKLTYIHENPIKAGLTTSSIDYPFSSAKFYETGNDEFGFLTSVY